MSTLDSVMVFSVLPIDGVAYCWHCQVIPAVDHEDYCQGCLDEKVEALAEQYNEQTALECGWY